MPTVTYQYPVPYILQVSPSFTRISALPSINICPTFPTEGWVSELSESWNCNTCKGEAAYVTRYKKGDIIPFLVRLPDRFNVDITNPLAGWNFTGAPSFYVEANLYGAGVCPLPLYTVVDDFCSDWWVYYEDSIGAYQVLFVDTALLAPTEKNFRLHVIAYDSLGNITAEIWSENFMEIDTSCQQYSFILEGRYNGLDCLNNSYQTLLDFRFNGDPYHKGALDPINYLPTTFYLQRRFLGQLLFTENTPEVTTDDNNNILQQKIFSTYTFYFQEMIPPYEAQILAAIIRADFVIVDNVEYTNFGNLSRGLEQGRMFLVKDLTCQTVCIINNRKCD